MDQPTNLQEVFGECAPRLLRYGYQLSHDAQRAQDLVQEAVVSALRYQNGRVIHAWEPYLRTTMTRCYLDRARTAASREFAVPDLPETHQPQPGLEQQVVNRDVIWVGLQTLPVTQRTALVLRYYLDLDDEQIATEIGCRPATVRSLLHRGLRVLKSKDQLWAGGQSR